MTLCVLSAPGSQRIGRHVECLFEESTAKLLGRVGDCLAASPAALPGAVLCAVKSQVRNVESESF
jgi:hypothetical protein